MSTVVPVVHCSTGPVEGRAVGIATQASAARLETAAMALLWLGFCATKALSIWGKSPVYSGDGRIWALIAEAPLFSRDFLLPRRPIVLPLLYKLPGLSDQTLVGLQLALSLLAWGWLAHALARLSRGACAIFVFAATLAVALTTPVHAWDLVVRAESTSHSLLVLTIAAAIHFLKATAESPGLAYWCAAGTAFFGLCAAFARDTNGYVLLLLVGAVVAGVWVSLSSASRARGQRGAALCGAAIIAAALTLASVGSQLQSRAAARYDFPLMNVIFRRVLPDPIKRDYFVRELGMPMSRALMQRSHEWASSNRRHAFRAASLQSFRDWLMRDGYAGYQRYLLVHLGLTMREAYDQFPMVLGYDTGKTGRSSRTFLSESVDRWLVHGPISLYPALTCSAIALVCAAGIGFGRRCDKLLGLLGGFLLVASLCQLYVCFHGDAMEVARHSVVVGLLLRVGLVTAFALLLSAFVRGLERLRWSRRRMV